MKKYIYISAVALGSLMLGSCELDAPSYSTMDAEQVYTNPKMAEDAVMAVLDVFGTNNSYRNRLLRYGAINTDIEWINTPSYKDKETGKYDVANYDTEPSNDQIRDGVIWSSLYSGIEKATIAIDYLEKYSGENAELKQLWGEALTLRAVLYTELIKYYGDVPARFEQTTNSNIYLPRASRDEIILRLLDDLAEAEKYCAWPNETPATSTTERVSKSFVKGLRARIALYGCGYALRDNNGKPDYSISTNPKLSKEVMLPIVLKECSEVIEHYWPKGEKDDDEKKVSITLPPFEQNFRKLCQDITTAGEESLWEIPYVTGRGQFLYAYAPKHNGRDKWVAKDGANYGGANGPVPTFFYDYDPDDIRRDITCVPYGFKDGVPELSKVQAMYFGKVRYEWMARPVDTQDDGVNVQYMRLADVFLMAAEAANELGNRETAWNYMEPVLARAYPDTKVEALGAKYKASKEAFFEGIVEQRAFEFAGEMIRKFDLIRWGLLDTKLAETKRKLALLPQADDNGERIEAVGPYQDIPSKLYYKVDGTSIKIYGLNHGDTDEEGKRLVDEEGYKSKGWFWGTTDGKTTNLITDDIINGYYTVDKPSEHCVWPIPSTIIANDMMGLLNNHFLGK